MKKLLLLSVLCVFAQIKTVEIKFSRVTIKRNRKIKNLKKLLKSVTYQEIEDDLKFINIDSVKRSEDQKSLPLKFSKLQQRCWEIIRAVSSYWDNSRNLNPVEEEVKEELKSLLPLCVDFASNIQKAFQFMSSEKDSVVQDCTELKNKAMELMQNK